jgi:hypothetical protein
MKYTEDELKELAKMIGRSVQSIQIKRSRLKSLGYI